MTSSSSEPQSTPCSSLTLTARWPIGVWLKGSKGWTSTSVASLQELVLLTRFTGPGRCTIGQPNSDLKLRCETLGYGSSPSLMGWLRRKTVTLWSWITRPLNPISGLAAGSGRSSSSMPRLPPTSGLPANTDTMPATQCGMPSHDPTSSVGPRPQTQSITLALVNGDKSVTLSQVPESLLRQLESSLAESDRRWLLNLTRTSSEEK